MKNVIKEGYKEINELIILADLIIDKLADKTYPVLNSIIEKKSPFYQKFDTSISVFHNVIRSNYMNLIQKFEIIDEFLGDLSNSDIDLEVYLTPKNANVNAKYLPKLKDIYLYNSNKIIEELNQTYFKNRSKDDLFTKEESKKIVKEIIEMFFKDYLVHELQHAFDDYRSEGKFIKDKRSKDFYQKKRKIARGEIEQTSKFFDEYLNLPHEYWARFSEYISKYKQFILSDRIKNDFNLLLYSFKENNIIKYNSIKEDNDKKRLIKALYKYWYLTHHKNEK